MREGFKYIENESFQSTFQGLFSEINLGSEKLGKTHADTGHSRTRRWKIRGSSANVSGRLANRNLGPDSGDRGEQANGRERPGGMAEVRMEMVK